MMQTIVAYDIRDDRTRARIFRLLEELGLNTQRSVFECELDARQRARIQAAAEELLDPETDTLLIYPLCRRCARRVWVLGQGIAVVHTDWMVV